MHIVEEQGLADGLPVCLAVANAVAAKQGLVALGAEDRVVLGLGNVRDLAQHRCWHWVARE